jgi:hypothetical protein
VWDREPATAAAAALALAGPLSTAKTSIFPADPLAERQPETGLVSRKERTSLQALNSGGNGQTNSSFTAVPSDCDYGKSTAGQSSSTCRRQHGAGFLKMALKAV